MNILLYFTNTMVDKEENMKRKLFISFSTILSFSGLYYLISELIAIINCKDSYYAYFSHTISELALPKGQLWYGKVSSFSSLAVVMNTALIINGIVFYICYCICLTRLLHKKARFFCLLLAFIVTLGSIFVGLFHGGALTRGIHDIGTIMVFAGGNILLLLTGIFFKPKKTTFYRIFCIILGVLGLASGGTILLTINTDYYRFVPVLERLAVYPIVFFEIFTGIYVVIFNKRFLDSNKK